LQRIYLLTIKFGSMPYFTYFLHFIDILCVSVFCWHTNCIGWYATNP